MASIIVGRVICGFGIGFISTTVPVYQNEQSIDKDTRGRGMAITCVFLASGVPVAYWLGESCCMKLAKQNKQSERARYAELPMVVDYGMSFVQNSVSWRFPIALQALPAIIAGAIFVSSPSPYLNSECITSDRLLRIISGHVPTHHDGITQVVGLTTGISLCQDYGAYRSPTPLFKPKSKAFLPLLS